MKRIMLWWTMTQIAASVAVAQDPRLVSILQDGEELRYKVRWSIFRLGTLTIRTEAVDTADSAPLYRVSMLVESNPSIPFVDLTEFNACLVDNRQVMSRKFVANWRDGKKRILIESAYDPTTRTMAYSEQDGQTGRVLKRAEQTDVDPYVHGPSLFVFTRWISDRNGEFVVPTLSNGEIAATRLRFDGYQEMVSVDGIGGPVQSRRYEGKAEWNGGTSAGLGGAFTGWVTTDEAAVVVKAEMKVLLGSITIELEQWHRPGWAPPTMVQTAQRTK
jgi:hypothetical protein